MIDAVNIAFYLGLLAACRETALTAVFIIVCSKGSQLD